MTALLRLPELEKYELLEEIGHGGMATVFRARDRRLGREVAIKLIHRHLRDKREVAERFVREATAVAKLHHDNIVEVFDISDPEESERYLVVELIRGQTLRQRLDEGGPMPPEVAVAVALEVAAGLAHAHRQGVVHRDVKPENVLLELSAGGVPETAGPPPVHVKLTDFGIAKLLDAQGVTSTGEVLGSPAHMAPEQIEGGEVGPATDVFALGVLLYECMVGALPFQGEHPAQVLRKVLEGDFVPPERRDAKIGASYSRLVTRALSRNPEDRFPTVESFAEALRAELGALGYGKVQPLLNQLMRPDPCFVGELAQRLVERGTAVRAGGDLRLAADYFGRALAYLPGDRALLRRISGLERVRFVRRVARVGALSAVALGLFSVGYGAWSSSRADAPPAIDAPRADAPLENAGDPTPANPGGGAAARQGGEGASGGEARPTASEPPGEGEATLAKPADRARRPVVPKVRIERRVFDRPPVARPPTRSKRDGVVPGDDARDVVVHITGAMGGTVKIDGEPVKWFGDVKHSLALGPHHFEFVTPDSTCCRSTERTVEVVAGEGPQRVVGEIPFRDATLRVSAPAGETGYLNCPTLFSGNQPFPGQRTVSMSRARASGDCTVKPDAPGALPTRKLVTLRAGQTAVIQWP